MERKELVQADRWDQVPTRGERPTLLAAIPKEQEWHHLHQWQCPWGGPDSDHEATQEAGCWIVPVQNWLPGGNKELREGASGSADRYVLGLRVLWVPELLLKFHMCLQMPRPHFGKHLLLSYSKEVHDLTVTELLTRHPLIAAQIKLLAQSPVPNLTLVIYA